MPSIEEVLETYIAAWFETDPELRLGLLMNAWADDGVYLDPSAAVEGRAALVDHLGAFQGEYPDHKLMLLSGIDSHHECARFEWGLADPDGNTVITGTDFAVFGDDGRLQSVTGFFGPSPPIAN